MSELDETKGEINTEKHKTPLQEKVPFLLQKLDSLVEENNGYFALGRVSEILMSKFVKLFVY